ncbi:hypothetical protein ACS0TY_034866 [Phlomoides rotata]
MVKFLKPNKAVVVLQGRYAGRKAVIIATILTALLGCRRVSSRRRPLKLMAKKSRLRFGTPPGKRDSALSPLPTTAAPAQDDKLRVFKWPSMEIILNEAPHPSVKDLNFRALVSTSMDSSSRVTLIKDKKKDGMNLWIILLIIILAIYVYYAKPKNLSLCNDGFAIDFSSCLACY